MGKASPDAFLDAALNTVKTAGTRIVITSGEPANFAAVAGVTLGASDHASSTPATALTSADFTGPADATSGRKLDVNARAGIYCSAAGSATHVCVTSASVLLYVTTCTAQTVAIGNKVNMPLWTINIQDPT